MSDAGNIKAGGAEVSIATEMTPLEVGLKKAQDKLKAWGNGLQAIGGGIFKPLALAGAAGLGGLTMIAQQLGDFGGEIDDMSQRTGLTTEAVSELGHAATMSGTDLATLEGALLKMEKTTSDAAAGSKKASETLRMLGLSSAELAGLTPDQQMEKFADSIARLESPADRVSAAMMVFGKSGTKLLPMLQGGAEGLRELRQEAVDLGLSMSGTDAKAAAELGDQLDKLKASSKAAAFNLGLALVPTLNTVFTTIAGLTGTVATWVRENRNLFVMLVTGGLAAVGVVAGVGAAIWGLGTAFSVLGVAIGVVQAMITGFAVVMGVLVSTPALIVAGLAALTAWFLTCTETGQEALAWLGQAWRTLSGEVQQAWMGIVAAVGSGDLKTAFAVVMAFGSLQWVKLVQFILQQWNHATLEVQAYWVTVTTEMANVWSAFAAGLIRDFVRAADIITPLASAIAAKLGMKQLALGYQIAGMAVQGAALTGAEASDQAIVDRNKSRDAELDRINKRKAAGDSAADLQLAAAQAQLAAASAYAQAAPSPDSPNGPNTGSGPTALKKLSGGADKAKSLASEAVDIRSQEGMKAVLASITGRNDAQDEIAATTKATADAAIQTADETTKTRRLLEDDGKEDDADDLN